MTIAAGTRIGGYEITGQLGAGGMGEVYRARDTKLDREVALKVLPESFATDADRLMRFEREAKTLAALNHPHIAHIHGFEEGLVGPVGQVGQVSALVMELVEGEDLAQRITRGPVPLDEALPIAKQIAEALEAAHEQGIIHRDLKPANIKVRPDGTVKVLDFGLAKALEGTGGAGRAGGAGQSALLNSPTLSIHATQAGMILGTVAYMAPEQAKGKAVDTRADIWAFGCVCYEMLAGRRAFKGDDVTDTITAVMRDTPDWGALPQSTPAHIRTLLRRCLERDLRKRIPHIAVARIEIEDAMAAPGDIGGIPAPSPPTRAAWMRTLGFGLAMAVAASAVTLLLTRTAPVAGAPAVLRYSLDLPPLAPLTTNSTMVSPNGRFIAINGRTGSGVSQLWVRALDGTEFAAVSGTTGAVYPFWSPDSSEIGFIADYKLLRVAMQGGTPREIANVSSMSRTTQTFAGGGGRPAWGADGTILFVGDDGIYSVPSAGGSITKVVEHTTPAGGIKPSGYGWPGWVTSQGGFSYTYLTGPTTRGGGLIYRSPADGKSVELVSPRSRAQVTPHGLLVWRQEEPSGSSLSLHAFDPATGTLAQPGTRLVDNVAIDFSASETGVLVYRRTSAGATHRFEWTDSRGEATAEGFDVVGSSPFNLSRDGALLAYNENGGVFIRDLTRGVATRLVENGLEPILSPDGRQVAYSVINGREIVVQPSSGGPSRVVFKDQTGAITEDWSSDGKFLAANAGGRGLIIPLDTDQAPITYAEGGASKDETRFSPDGRWLTFNTSESGRSEAYLIPLPPTGERWQLSLDGGSQARWRGDGRAIYYLSSGGDLMMVDLDLAPGTRPRIGRPRKLFATGLVPTPLVDQFAVNHDGSRFLLRRPLNASRADQVEVIINWPGLIKAQ